MGIDTKFLLWLNFKQKGVDKFGNKYYESKRVNKYTGRKTRSVMFKGLNETSKVPPGWHGWLHYSLNEAPKKSEVQYDWQKEYLPNLTGTRHAYRPKSHMIFGGIRANVASDYWAWRP